MIRPLLALLCCSLAISAASAEDAQTATVLRVTPLLAEPFSDAAQLLTLQAQQQVSIVSRKGGWYQVQHDTTSGWLRMSHIRFGTGAAAQSSGNGLAQTLSFLSTGRSGASGVTVATGIRGLDSSDISNATPNHLNVNRLDKYKVLPKQAFQFAANAKLKTRQLAYIEAPGSNDDSQIPGVGEDW